MKLTERVAADLVAAMKERAELRLSVLRMRLKSTLPFTVEINFSLHYSKSHLTNLLKQVYNISKCQR